MKAFCLSSTINGVKTEFLVDKNLPYAQVLEERVNNGLTASYVYGNDLISQQRGSEKSFYLVDGLGSTRGLTNAGGVVTDRYSYDGFGNLIGVSGSTENNYLFAGEQFDKGLGDYYLRARYYDTDTGRFTRRDSYEGSIDEPVTLHKYLYGNANPVTYIDPSGQFSIQEIVTISSIIGTIAGTSLGGYTGYQRSGKLLSITTFGYALLGAVTGGTLGAQLGSLIAYFSGSSIGLSASGATFGTIIKMTPKMVQQIARIISSRSLIYRTDGSLKGLTATSFAAGVVSGAIGGIFTPDEFEDEVSVGALTAYGGGNALTIGYEWLKSNIQGLRRVPGSAQLGLTYVAGFNLGYFAALRVRQLLEP
ncbi:RHS repeat-associated core domain-containing protein [Argonema antarcticum]|uniref:RHS repeat-associated core domain-containing protein n=1 Tax=Argonema antarcticum TaxID=2942763 RepID=UPI002013659C|nr:RHS repeat-associated core domain-containing protein [Argonema antarcticum]MCL1475329.1 RHS repeat-associated core domain-containing protein [Argonema antarcticum A004/B2]